MQKEEQKCIVINLAGAPGAGKSTGAAYIFSRLKMMGINAELITEYAKRKVWEESYNTLENQLYIFGKQYHSMYSCKDKVDVIVTDSPLFLSAFYNHDSLLGEDFNKVVMNVFNSFENLTFFLDRTQPYNPVGRIQTEEESNEFSVKMKKMMDDRHIEYFNMPGEEKTYEFIANYVGYMLRTPGTNLESAKDYYIIHEDTDRLTLIYFNEDGNSGLGQIVISEYDLEEVREKADEMPEKTIHAIDWRSQKTRLLDNPEDWLRFNRENMIFKNGYFELDEDTPIDDIASMISAGLL